MYALFKYGDNLMLLSIIVPIFNVYKYLPQCIDGLIESINEEDVGKFEIILIDDGSTDSSGNIAKDYADKYSYISYFEKSNGGLSDARNYGIGVAKGRFFSFIDSDDIVNPAFVSLVLDYIESYSFDLLSFDFCKFQDEELVDFKSCAFTPFFVELDFYCDKPLYAWNKIYSQHLFEHTKFTNGLYYEDVALIPRLIESANTRLHVNKCLYGYRQRKGSITSFSDDKYLDILTGVKFNQDFSSSNYIMSVVSNQFFTLTLLSLRLSSSRYFKNMNKIIIFYMENMRLDKIPPFKGVKSIPYWMLRKFGRSCSLIFYVFMPLVKVHLFFKKHFNSVW